MNSGTPAANTDWATDCIVIEIPAIGVVRKAVCKEKKCPAITLNMANALMRSRPNAREDVLPPLFAFVKTLKIIAI